MKTALILRLALWVTLEYKETAAMAPSALQCSAALIY